MSRRGFAAAAKGERSPFGLVAKRQLDVRVAGIRTAERRIDHALAEGVRVVRARRQAIVELQIEGDLHDVGELTVPARWKPREPEHVVVRRAAAGVPEVAALGES